MNIDMNLVLGNQFLTIDREVTVGLVDKNTAVGSGLVGDFFPRLQITATDGGIRIKSDCSGDVLAGRQGEKAILPVRGCIRLLVICRRKTFLVGKDSDLVEMDGLFGQLNSEWVKTIPVSRHFFLQKNYPARLINTTINC